MGPKRVAPSLSPLMSDSAQLRVTITVGADWRGPILPVGSAVPPGLHLNPNACLVFTGLMLPPFWTLWDLICFHFCSQLCGLQAYRFLCACPLRCSPMRLFQPSMLLSGLRSLQQSCQFGAWSRRELSWPFRQALLVQPSCILPFVCTPQWAGLWF